MLTTLDRATERRLRVLEGFQANPMDFGAVGNGTADDAAAVQAAVNAVITAGGGVIKFPPNRVFGVGTMIDATRANSVDLRFIGHGSGLKALATIEALLKLARTGSQGAYRFPTVVDGLKFYGASKAWTGIKCSGGHDVLALHDLYFEYCTGVGLDIEGMMESTFDHLTFFNNTNISLRLRPVVDEGGGNGNKFSGVNITNGKVGIAFYDPYDAYPFHDDTFAGTTIQGTTVAGILAIGVRVSNMTFIGGHCENSLAYGTESVDLGDYGAAHSLTVGKSDVVAYSSRLRLIGLENVDTMTLGAHNDIEAGESTELPQMAILDTLMGSNTGVTGTFQMLSGKSVRLDNCSFAHRGGKLELDMFYRSAVAYEGELPRVEWTSSVNQAPVVGTGATLTNEYNTGIGYTYVCDYAASASSYGTNDFRFGVGTVPANQFVYASVLAKADADTRLYMTCTGGAQISLNTIVLRANTWTLVRQGSYSTGSDVIDAVSFQTIDSDGPTVRFAKVFACLCSSYYETAAAYNANASVGIQSDQEPWRYVGAAGQPAFANSWVNFGGDDVGARFRKSLDGRVTLSGMIKSGTVGQAAFTLPVGYRSKFDVERFAVCSNGAAGAVYCAKDGTVKPWLPSNNAWVSLEGVTFYTD